MRFWSKIKFYLDFEEFTKEYSDILGCPKIYERISEYISTGEMAQIQIQIIFEGHFNRIFEYLNIRIFEYSCSSPSQKLSIIRMWFYFSKFSTWVPYHLPRTLYRQLFIQTNWIIFSLSLFQFDFRHANLFLKSIRWTLIFVQNSSVRNVAPEKLLLPQDNSVSLCLSHSIKLNNKAQLQ